MGKETPAALTLQKWISLTTDTHCLALIGKGNLEMLGLPQDTSKRLAMSLLYIIWKTAILIGTFFIMSFIVSFCSLAIRLMLVHFGHNCT